jgi:hypothetical protein
LAGIVTCLVTCPFEQAILDGRPVIFGVEENVQVFALVTFAESVTSPPAQVSEEGLALKSETAGCGSIPMRILIAWALTVVVPLTDRPKAYVIALVPVFLGTVTLWRTVPLAQGFLAGKPLIAGATENVHDVARDTLADRVTVPPTQVSRVGAAVKEDTVGLADTAWASEDVPTTATPARMRVRTAPMTPTVWVLAAPNPRQFLIVVFISRLKQSTEQRRNR